MNSKKGIKVPNKTEFAHELYLEYLKQQPQVGFETNVNKIDTYFQTKAEPGKNFPLAIIGEQGSGKSGLIAKWFDYQNRPGRKVPELYLMHFSKRNSLDTNYYLVLYKFLNKLRDEFDIRTKLEITEEKIRGLMTRWLESANEKIVQGQINYRRIVIIVDGVDKFVDSTGKEERPDWLPYDMPSHVKAIYTANSESKAAKYLQAKSSTSIELLDIKPEHRELLLDRYLENFEIGEKVVMNDRIEAIKDLMAAPECPCKNRLYLNFLFSLVFVNLQNKFPFESLTQYFTIETLLTAALDHIEGTNKRATEKILMSLALTKNGLTDAEIAKISDCRPNFWYNMQIWLKVVIVHNKGYYSITNDCFRNYICARYAQTQEQKLIFHSNLAKMFAGDRKTIRTVDETIYHYAASKNWIKLKDTLCDMEVFCLMYSPPYKMDLGLYWQRLEFQNLDPTTEYNRSLETIINQFSGKTHDLFIFQIQLWRFFKEFADHETDKTPEFRHPNLKGQFELEAINLLEEVSKYQDLYNQNTLESMRDEEKFTSGNKPARAALKASILDTGNEEVTEKTKDTQKFYYYKRWLWMQFAWCSLDVYSDLSSVMNKFSANTDFQSADVDNDLAINMIKIIKDQKNEQQKTKRKSVSMTRASMSVASMRVADSSHMKLPRIMSTNKIRRDLGIKTTNMDVAPDYEEELDPLSMTLPLKPLVSFKKQKRQASPDRDFTFNIKMTELTPNNVLFKLGNRVQKYSKHEIHAKQRENYKLQKQYNELVNQNRLRNQSLGLYKAQLNKGADKLKEQEETKNMLVVTQSAMEKVYEKLNKAEIEHKRLLQVVNACFKNPAKNDDWVRSLEKAIDNMIDLTSCEKDEIESNVSEVVLLDQEMNNLKKWFASKVNFQNQTIERVAEQFIIKTNLRENLINGDRRRKEIAKMSLIPKQNENYKKKIKMNERTKQQVRMAKKILTDKLQDFESTFEKLQQATDVKEPDEIGAILEVLQHSYDLRQTYEKYNEKIDEMRQEKDSMAERLHLLSVSQAENVTENNTVSSTAEDEDHYLHKIAEADHILQHYSMKLRRQNVIYSTCKLGIEQLRRTLKITDESSIEIIDVQSVIECILEKLDFYTEKVQSTIGTLDYDHFEILFPEVQKSMKIACSNVDNIRIQIKYRNVSDLPDSDVSEVDSQSSGRTFDINAMREAYKAQDDKRKKKWLQKQKDKDSILR